MRSAEMKNCNAGGGSENPPSACLRRGELRRSAITRALILFSKQGMAARQIGAASARFDKGMVQNDNCAWFPLKGATSFLGERYYAKIYGRPRAFTGVAY
jgi:hypothetical protein